MTNKDLINEIDPTIFHCRKCNGWVSINTMECNKCHTVFVKWVGRDNIVRLAATTPHFKEYNDC